VGLLDSQRVAAVRADPTVLEATVACLFVIMGRQGDEMIGADGRAAEMKYKARGVLAGNSIQSKCTLAHELFQEVAQTPASLVSARAALAAGAIRGHRATVRDATTAYLQASLKTHFKDGSERPTQWVRLPRSWWPADWFESDGVTPKFYDPSLLQGNARSDQTRSGPTGPSETNPDLVINNEQN
jgi:hypothetical protein